MDPQHFDPSQLGLLFSAFAVFFALVTIVMIIPYWVIFRKAGFSPWLSLLQFVPLANIIVLYVVAFSEWHPEPTISPRLPDPRFPDPRYQPRR